MQKPTPSSQAPLSYLKAIPHLFWIPGLLVALLLFFGATDPDALGELTQGINRFIYQHFGGFYLWFALGTLCLFVLIALSPMGNVRLGGPDARPEHSVFSWIAMLFCCGMGIGFMMWGAAEPLYHYMNPPIDGLSTPLDKESAAFYFTFLHWGLQPWAIYGMTALVIGFFGFNQCKGFCFSAFMAKDEAFGVHSLRRRIVMEIIDLVTIIAIIFGIAATMASGVLVIEGGMQSLFGIKPGVWTHLGIIGVLSAVYLVSAARGLNKGIKILSNVSVVMSILLLASVIWFGPQLKMMRTLFDSVPGYLSQLPQLSLGLEDFRRENWINEWTIKYWSWWIAWAPFVGLFVAIISRGRTIREMLLAVMIVPSIFSFIWFTAFGEAAISMQQTGGFVGDSFQWENVTLLLYQMFEHYTHSPILSWLSLVLIAIFICNSADSASYIMTCFTHRRLQEQVQTRLQLSWGVLFAILTAVLLMLGGSGGDSKTLYLLQQVTQITALPFTLLLVVVFVAMIRGLIRYWYQERDRRDEVDPEPLPQRPEAEKRRVP